MDSCDIVNESGEEVEGEEDGRASCAKVLEIREEEGGELEKLSAAILDRMESWRTDDTRARDRAADPLGSAGRPSVTVHSMSAARFPARRPNAADALRRKTVCASLVDARRVGSFVGCLASQTILMAARTRWRAEGTMESTLRRKRINPVFP